MSERLESYPLYKLNCEIKQQQKHERERNRERETERGWEEEGKNKIRIYGEGEKKRESGGKILWRRISGAVSTVCTSLAWYVHTLFFFLFFFFSFLYLFPAFFFNLLSVLISLLLPNGQLKFTQRNFIPFLAVPHCSLSCGPWHIILYIRDEAVWRWTGQKRNGDRNRNKEIKR